MSNFGRMAWNLVIQILRAMGDVWDFLSNPVDIGKIEVFGVTLFEGITFTPLAFGGVVILAILIIGLISLFNPFN